MNKKDWGNAVWFLLHTLAHKLLPQYSDHARFVLPMMIRIATHLPCEQCSSHAREMLLSMQTRPLRSKQDLIEFWREAHNRVNKRIGTPQFSLAECLEKYDKANTQLVVQNYQRVITGIRVGERGLGDSWRRGRVMDAFRKYLTTHAYMFSR